MNGRTTFYLFLAGLFMFGFHQNCAQDSGFMYGQITTIDDDRYSGAIRWGKEEAYWTDHFNASKEENNSLDYLSDDEREELEDAKRNQSASTSWVSVNWNGWSAGSEDFLHQFVCQFGEIKRIIPTGRQEVDLELQNGEIYELSGEGYNDIGTEIKVADPELGIINLSWSRISKIEFMETPSKLENSFGKPLYGTVESRGGKFTGFIQWDHDERVDTDVLDGDTDDGDVSIEFGNISSIERYGSSRSKITLQGGRELTLRGSNDVNDENRGIIVTIEGMGRVDIPWDEFDKVTFSEARESGPAYKEFAKQKRLNGSVTTKVGDRISGDLIFDLDETFDFEIIQGMDDDLEYLIPLRNIASIEPKNYEYSTIKLKNGSEYLLGESQDVSDRNQGVIVLDGSNSTYIEFAGIEIISFR